jgi:hypothetical protein
VKIETVVCRSAPGSYAPEERFSVHARIDGALTTWSCSHLHHSERAATKCVGQFDRYVHAFLSEAQVTRIPYGPHCRTHDLYEARIDYSVPERVSTGRTGRSLRFAMPYDGVTPVTAP